MKSYQRIELIQITKKGEFALRTRTKIGTNNFGNSPSKSTIYYRTRFLYDVAQSARESRKTPLSIEPFWEKANIRPTDTMGKKVNSSRTGQSRKRKYNVRHFASNKTDYVRLPPKPKYEIAIEDATEHTERDCQIRNNQFKLQWELKLTEAGILCGEIPWTPCDKQCVSVL